MDQPLPPEAWRSEAFAEDLPEPAPSTPEVALGRWRATLLGLVPLSLATAGASMLAVWTKV
jgi:hypothetical protein